MKKVDPLTLSPYARDEGLDLGYKRMLKITTLFAPGKPVSFTGKTGFNPGQIVKL